jgi:hypothetical protein
MPVGELRKRRKVRSLAAEHHQKRKERTRGNRGSRRKLAAACRKVSRCAGVAWHKKSVVRKIGTQENCGPHKEFTAAGIRVTRCAKVARRKGCSHEGLLGTTEDLDQDKICKSIPKRTDSWNETTHVPGRHQWNQELRFQGTATSLKRENNQQDIQEDHQTGDREASSKDFQRDAEAAFNITE